MLIRPIESDEYARLGVLTLLAYTTLEGHVSEPDYEEELADVRTRAEAPSTVVLVAVDDDGELLGGVTYVADERSPFAEHSLDGAASIRMLAVDESRRRSGAGEALVRACIDRAHADGRAEVFLHSTPWMLAAHKLYEKLGFVRDPEHDWDVTPGIQLFAFRLPLRAEVHELGPWQPLSLTDVRVLFEAAPFRWWISGGRALELHLGRTWRDHEDADVGMVRDDVPLLGSVLASWDIHLAAAGHLSQWTGRPLLADAHENNLWCRRSTVGPWELDITVGEGDSDAWIYRRDPTVRIPWDEAVLHRDGLWYLAPELQLLFKSKDIRPKDDVDAREVIPSLDPQRQHRLADLLPERHPWRALLGQAP